MNRICVAIAICLLTCSAVAGDLSLIDTALAQVGLQSEDLGFDQDEMATWGGDAGRLSYFTLYHKNPLRLPDHSDLIREGLANSIGDLTDLVAFAGRRIDCPIRRGLIGDQLEQYVVSSDTVPLRSITGKRNVLVKAEYRTLRNGIDLFYRVVEDKKGLFYQALDPVDKSKYREKLFEFFVHDNDAELKKIEEIRSKVDMNRLVAGIEDITEAVMRLADSLDVCTFPHRIWKMETDRGNIYIGTAGDDTYEYLDAPLLIVDGGGNDTYRFHGENPDYPVAAIVDLAGNDTYISADSTRPGIGGAILGLSIVIDKDGDDTYAGEHLCQGAGIFGFGGILDYAGNDVYSARFFSQGSGTYGLGVLADVAGNDSLSCWASSQGFGYSGGCGLLVNGSGDDVYYAEDDSLFSPASQTSDHNSSLSQGVGFGRRADFIDGHSWAGGIGILGDLAGDDSYSAGLFAQGCAYWFSVGMLIDGDGRDSYNGIWYVQGSGAHFGVGFLDDINGDDRYVSAKNMAAGAGHDFTIGFLNDRAGNDYYSVPNLSLGGGNANGIGIFYDHQGDDTYDTHGGTTLGRANTYDQGIRGHLRCFGVFVDGGGNDSYLEAWAKNQSRWIGPASNEETPNPAGIGVGIDF